VQHGRHHLKTDDTDPAGACTGSANNCCRPNGPSQADSSFCNNNPGRCCRRDAVGIPRCTLNDVDCTANPPPPGASCATSADCCGKPCVDNVCLGACVDKGGECTSTADCCAGQPCTIPTGSSKGICGGVIGTDGGVEPPPEETDGGTPPPPACALYGQSCNINGDCCDGVPCTNKTCRYP
jgi:hypothetical protein